MPRTEWRGQSPAPMAQRSGWHTIYHRQAIVIPKPRNCPNQKRVGSDPLLNLLNHYGVHKTVVERVKCWLEGGDANSRPPLLPTIAPLPSRLNEINSFLFMQLCFGPEFLASFLGLFALRSGDPGP